jgi:predicted enzyme related to lactoylglutathione lyase
MSLRTSYAPGTPSWIDLSSPDVDASAAFYGALFGWTFTPAEPVEEAGGYGMFTLDGHRVAGMGPKQDPSMPTVWMTYVTTTDLDATIAKAQAAGGGVHLPAMAVFDAGSMAIVSDVSGGVLALWQPDQHIGAELVNAPGALVWNELNVRDTAGVADFYAAVFGWSADTADMGGGFMYTTWTLPDGARVGGMLEMPDGAPVEVPAYWATYFGVADTDATVEQAVALGAKVIAPAMDIPIGRFAYLMDPPGAVFAVIQMREWAD